MSAARRLVHGLWLATGLVLVTGVAMHSLEDAGGIVSGIIVGLPVAMYGTVGALVARRRPENPIGWLFCSIALSLALWVLGSAYAGFGSEAEKFGTLFAAAAVAWIGILTPITVLCVALPAFLLVFPDGALRARRWRLAIVVAAIGGVLATIGLAATVDRYSATLPLASPDWIRAIPSVGGFLAGGLLLTTGAAVAGLVCLAVRYREAEGERRQQLRLLLWMLVAMAVAPLLAFLGWPGLIFVFLVDGGGILVGIPAATAIAVLTFGLYDVGIVLKKTVVYGLIVMILTLFTGLVVFFVSPIGPVGAESRGGDGATLRIITGLMFVVVTIAATSRITRRLARRMVYGRRATPYEAMTEFSERMGEAYATDDVLPRMAEIVRASTGADVTRIWLLLGGELRPVAAAPSEALELAAITLEGDALPEIEGVRAFPVRHLGDLLGALTLTMPAAEPLSKTSEQLVSDLASQAGLVLRNVRLIQELQASRRRIVSAQDERARILERNIHDGAQQQLVALSVKLGLAEHLAASDPAKIVPLLADLKVEATDALENLRDLARGIYPPLLADKGLPSALTAQTRRSPIPVSVAADGVGRLPQAVEAAVYFCCLEALQNVAKYANASSVTVSLERANGSLMFAVADDGDGFDVAGARSGTGLQGMEDRLSALGGRLDVRSEASRGSTVTGNVPITEERGT